MTIQQFLKGLMMLLVSVVVTALSQTPVDVPLLIATSVAVILSYSGKNLIAVLHSDSQSGTLTLINILSGVLVAGGTAITEYIALIVVDHKMVWPVFLKVVGSATFTYLGATLFAPPNKHSRKLFTPKKQAA